MSLNKAEITSVLEELKAKAEKVFADLEHRLKTLIDPTSHEQVSAQLAASKASLDTHLAGAGEALSNTDDGIAAGSTSGTTGEVANGTAVGAIGTGDVGGAATGSDAAAAGSTENGAASDTAADATAKDGADAASGGDTSGVSE